MSNYRTEVGDPEWEPSTEDTGASVTFIDTPDGPAIEFRLINREPLVAPENMYLWEDPAAPNMTDNMATDAERIALGWFQTIMASFGDKQ